MSSKPKIVYIDDEANNLVIFEAAMSDAFEVLTFDNPLRALDELSKIDPCVIASDQRMPGIMGVNLLEIAKKICPNAQRVLITGYSEEDLIIDAVRKANVSDYIRKPWDPDDLAFRIEKLYDVWKLDNELKEKTKSLELKNETLTKLNVELSSLKENEENLRKELESWAPPFLIELLNNKDLKFPIIKDISLMTYDIINSSKLHDLNINSEKTIQKTIMDIFEEAVIKCGGCLESSAGDSAYAHFGVVKDLTNSADSAFSAASEFRTKLRRLCNLNKLDVECGIGMHFAKNCHINLSSNKILFDGREVIRKSFNTTSSDIDLVHRIEKISHELPGSNIIFTEEFLGKLSLKPTGIHNIGKLLMKGQKQSSQIFLKASDQVSSEMIERFIKKLSETFTTAA